MIHIGGDLHRRNQARQTPALQVAGFRRQHLAAVRVGPGETSSRRTLSGGSGGRRCAEVGRG